jgi:hypothetical protein
MGSGNTLIRGKAERSEDYAPQLRCLCGHLKEDHGIGWVSGEPLCNNCSILLLPTNDSYYHNFKLDNLSLIEDLAIKRGLI